MSHIHIRLAESSDIPALRAMQERSLRVLGRGFYSATQIEDFITRFGTMDDYLVADRTYLVAEVSGEIVGSAGWTTRMPGYARYTPDANLYAMSRRATIRSVFVEPLLARQGIGRRIMSAAENAVRGEGFRSVELGSTECGLAFYKTIGYEPLRPLQIELGPSLTFRITVMKKSLAAANSVPGRPSDLVA